MASYSNSSIVQYLRQYDMFSNSLKLIKNNDEKKMIIKQLTKLEYKILDATNENYVEEYNTLLNKECSLLADEKKRLLLLIDLINQRLSYVEKRCNDHFELTSQTLDVDSVLGADTLDNLLNRVKIIDKYTKNIKLYDELKNDLDNLNNKITLASNKIEINKQLNKELEEEFIKNINDAFESNNLYQLLDIKEQVELAYYETEKSLTLAEINLESAKTSPLNVMNDCQAVLDSVNEDYIKYKDKLSLLRLMEIFNKEVSNYQELVLKRKDINELFKYIKNEEFVNSVINMVSKQYNTIMMEQQDIDTFNDLVAEKNRKTDVINEIIDENNSDDFQNVLKTLIENEKKKEAKMLEEKKRLEEIEKKKKLEFEKKRQEEILKRQKIIEEARKKEIEKRTHELLEQQQKSVLQNNKEKGYSFSTIKSSLEKDNDLNIKHLNSRELDSNTADSKEKLIDLIEKKDSEKNKNEIEKELFDEFNNQMSNNHQDVDNLKNTSQLPKVSIDEYMKKFDEKELNNVGDFFGDDDAFPSIPL